MINKKLETITNRLIKALWKSEHPNIVLLPTKIIKSYWDKSGKYETQYHLLYEALIPERYGCSYPPAEALRILSRAYYRYYNDGDKVTAEVYAIVNDAVKGLKSGKYKYGRTYEIKNRG